jgi:hypothetical protein
MFSYQLGCIIDGWPIWIHLPNDISSNDKYQLTAMPNWIVFQTELILYIPHQNILQLKKRAEFENFDGNSDNACMVFELF